MSKPKISIVGALRFSEAEGLQFSVAIGDPPKRSFWSEALPNADDWPGIGKAPKFPEREPSRRRETPEELKDRRSLEESWARDRAAYDKALHADPSYRKAAEEFLERQRREPISLESTSWGLYYPLWVYRNQVLRLDSSESEDVRDQATELLLIKHYVLRKERHFEKVRREVEAFENIEKLEGVSREPIPEHVRLFVWQRDRGQCVKCASHERLEFDHIIPLAAGGSNTERNIQLLCETCNRSKGSTI